MNPAKKLQPGGAEEHQRGKEKAHGFETVDRSLKLAPSLELTLKETHMQIDEVLERLELDPADLLTKKGSDVLEEKLGKPFVGIAESGDKKPLGLKSKFMDADVAAFTSPGIQKENGSYPENRDGFVLIKTPDGQGLNVVMSHGMAEGPESAALANAATVSAGYDLQRMNPPHLTEIFERANDQVYALKKELDTPKNHLSLFGLTMKKGHPDSPLYDVEIFKAGDVHCFVFDPSSGSAEKVTPMTVKARMEKERMPMHKREELLKQYADRTGQTPQQIEKILTMWAGRKSDDFQPSLDSLPAAPGEIVVVATSDFMKSFGGTETFWDKNVARIMTERLKKGKKLNEVLADMMTLVVQRQKAGELEDYPLSVVAFEVPKGPKAPPRREMTVEEALGQSEANPE